MSHSFGKATEPVLLRSSGTGQKATHDRRDAETDRLIAASHARIAASQAHLGRLRRAVAEGQAFVDASLRDLAARRRALEDWEKGGPPATR